MNIHRLEWRRSWPLFSILALAPGTARCAIVSTSGPETTCVACCEVPTTGTDAGVLPPRPSAPAASATTATVFAISKLYVGDVDPAGQPSDTAWATYGLNIDGKVTAASSPDVCTRVAGANCETQLDGDDGIDNSFGENVVPIIETLVATYGAYVNRQIEHGGGTMLVQLEGLGSADSVSSLPGALYRALPTSQPLRWDGTDVRDVDDVSLVGADISMPLAVLPSGYMNHRVYVSGVASGTAYLDLQVTGGSAAMAPGFLPPIPIQHVQVAMQVASDGGSATSGTLSGVVRASDVAAWIQLWAGTVANSLCYGSAIELVSRQFEAASDIMTDGTNAPGKTCDGISVGLGFDAVAVHLGKAEAEPPFVNPCQEGGVDATPHGG